MENNLDILFINPPYERLKGFSLGSIPNGILGLATYIDQCGFKALVYDADTNDEGFLTYSNKNRAESQKIYAEAINNDDHHVWKEVKETIKNLNPRFVGISLMTPTFHAGLKIAMIAKELGKTVLVGGPHVNIVREKILELDLIDFSFFGEAEFSVIEFLKNFPDGNIQGIKGVGFKKDGKIVYNGFSDRIYDLDVLPFPDRFLLYFRERYTKTDLSNLMASRGCPYKCAFCASVPIWGRNTVFRSPGHVVDEIKYLHDNFGAREFRLFDDTFTAKKENVINFCKILIDTFGEKYFSWWCLSRANAIDEAILGWLKKAGCRQIHIGVESGSEKVLKLMHKGINLKQVEDVVRLSKKYGLWVNTFFMIGLPYETLEDMKMTIDFIKKIRPDTVNLCTFTPYPGTELYQYCIDKKLLTHDDNYELFKYIGHHSTSNYFLEHVSRDDYEKILNEALELTTKIGKTITYRKLKYRFSSLTTGKIKRYLKLRTNYLISKILKNTT